MEESYDKGQHLYFIKMKGFNRVKIGIAQNPQHRMEVLQIGNPYELRLICVVPYGGKFLEKLIQKNFSNYRGEWYEFSPALQEVIKQANKICYETGLIWHKQRQKISVKA